MTRTSLSPFQRFRGPAGRKGSAEDPGLVMRDYFDRLWQEFGRPFPMTNPFTDGGFLSPDVDVAETPDGLEITADLPGMSPEDVSLDVADGVLTLKAERRSEREEKGEDKTWHLVERTTGTFLRRFALPFTADEDAIEARFENGVLKVRVPRAKQSEDRAKKIEIKAG